MRYKILIPTRDSSRWLNTLICFYKRENIQPVFLLDTRTVDNSEQILINHRAVYHKVTPFSDFAESGMIEVGSSLIKDQWILRLDDDEFPSKELLDWLRYFDPPCIKKAYSISRRDVSLINGNYLYSNWPTRWGANGDYFLFNPQTRLFYPGQVSFLERIHTPGISIKYGLEYAPNLCFFIHFNNIVRSPLERLLKIRKYAQHDLNSWALIDESLPEITSINAHAFSDKNLEQFYPFLSSLPKYNADYEDIEITNDELRNALIMTQEWLAKSNNLARQVILSYSSASNDPFFILPASMLKLLAIITSFIGHILKYDDFSKLSEKYWRFYKLKTSTSK